MIECIRHQHCWNSVLSKWGTINFCKIFCVYFDFLIYILNRTFLHGSSILMKPNFNMGKTLVFLDLDEIRRMLGLSKNCQHSKSFQIRPFLRKFSHQNKRKCYLEKQALKCRIQALFLMQIQHLNSDSRGFDYLRFFGIKSESNQWEWTFSNSDWAIMSRLYDSIEQDFPKRQLNENRIYLARFVFDHFHSLLKQDFFTVHHNKKKSYVLCDC